MQRPGLAALPHALRMGPAIGLLLALLGLSACAPAAVEKIAAPEETPLNASGRKVYVTTARREGARQPFLLLVPPQPQAVAVLFSGGDGAIGLESDGSFGPGHNFLVRSREAFVQNGLAAAVIAPPTDRENMLHFRLTDAHVLDIKGVIAYLREKLHVPVWLVGTSRGTISVARITWKLPGPDGPDGLVLTSLVSAQSQGESVYDSKLNEIRVPTLLVQHRHDGCRTTPFSGAEGMLPRFSAAPAKALIPIDGGGPPRGDPCQGRHHHGFIGQEDEVVKAIADWIKAHPPAAR